MVRGDFQDLDFTEIFSGAGAVTRGCWAATWSRSVKRDLELGIVVVQKKVHTSGLWDVPYEVFPKRCSFHIFGSPSTSFPPPGHQKWFQRALDQRTSKEGLSGTALDTEYDLRSMDLCSNAGFAPLGFITWF